MTEFEKFNQLLAYDSATGNLIWKIRSSPRANAGSVAGCIDTSNGYRKIGVKGRYYFAHRVVWLLAFGCWPTTIDHIDGNRDNNKLSNLREVTASENQQNQGGPHRDNKTGYLGVSLNNWTGKYQAQIKLNGVSHQLGHYDTALEAHKQYLKAKLILHTHGDRLK